MPKCKKHIIYVEPTKENKSKSLHTPVNTPLCIEIRQGQFSWNLRSERITYVSTEEVCASYGADPNGEFGIFIDTLQKHTEINVNY